MTGGVKEGGARWGRFLRAAHTAARPRPNVRGLLFLARGWEKGWEIGGCEKDWGDAVGKAEPSSHEFPGTSSGHSRITRSLVEPPDSISECTIREIVGSHPFASRLRCRA